MDKWVKEFIEKNINLIEDNQWEEVYKKIESEGLTGSFTESLLDAGINPLDYLNYIPSSYLLNNSIKKFKIPSNIKSIGPNAFYLCEDLKDITIPDSVTIIGRDAFRSCSSLTHITIPDSVTHIGVAAFYDCASLTSINIGSGVTSIGDWAFYNCYGLTSINFKGTIEQWDSINKGNYWNYNVPTAVIKCKDGDKRYEP